MNFHRIAKLHHSVTVGCSAIADEPSKDRQQNKRHYKATPYLEHLAGRQKNSTYCTDLHSPTSTWHGEWARQFVEGRGQENDVNSGI
jgi:hypothetical protein